MFGNIAFVMELPWNYLLNITGALWSYVYINNNNLILSLQLSQILN